MGMNLNVASKVVSESKIEDEILQRVIQESRFIAHHRHGRARPSVDGRA